MVDASGVRLLRYARPTWSLVTPANERPRAGGGARPPATVYRLDLCTLRAPVDAAWRRAFEREVLPLLVEHGAPPCAVLETEPAANDYPRLPVRSGESVFTWLARQSLAALERGRAAASACGFGRPDAGVAPGPDRAIAAALRRDRAC